MNPWIVLAIYFFLAVGACWFMSLFDGPEDLEDA